MRWRLGLDVGTASVGAVAVELDHGGKEISVPWHLVRIFQEPNEKGQTGLTPKKAARRLARQQRRQLERRKRRVRKVAYLAPLLGLDRAQLWADGDKGFQLPALRAKAARERVELADLLRIFLRMAKRRGYAGGFRAARSDDELGVVQQGSSALQSEMAALAQRRQLRFVTLGEFLHDRIQRGLPGRLKIGRQDVADLFALRGMLQDEFDYLWRVQEEYHAVMRGQHKGRAIREWFRDAIFYQRPLRSMGATVGLCPLEKHLPRAPRAQMAAQRFRIEKTLADLRWGAGANAESLSGQQREILRRLLESPDALTNDATIAFKKLYKIFEKEGCPAPLGRTLNLDRASREELRGNSTLKAFSRLGLLERWLALDDRHQTSVINLLADLGSPEQLDADDWHQKFLRASAKPNDPCFRRFAPEVIAFIDLLRSFEGYGRLNAMGFETGRMAYSVKALNKLTDWLRSPAWRETPGSKVHVDEDAAARECYSEAFAARECSGKLEYPPKTGNDTVDVALAQVYWVIQDAIGCIGRPPAEIIIEFGREVGLSAARRNEWENQSAKNQRDRRRARDEILDNGHTPTNVAVRRYMQWQEQSTHCPYCSLPISLNDALHGHATHVDHIIPRSLTRVGRKRSELVIAHASCNSLKGNRTPWQAFGETERWIVIEERARQLEKKKKQYRKARLLLLKDFEQEVLTDASIAEFADRQLHQTSWIARATAQWLRGLCANVFAARGEFTAIMRRSWRLDTVIPEVRFENGRTVLDREGKSISSQQFDELRSAWEGHGRVPDIVLEKRLDHRHHVVDALVIALCSSSTYIKLAPNYKAALASPDCGSRSGQPRWHVEPPLPEVRAVALRMVRECRVSHKPDRFASGKYFQDTAYSEVRTPSGNDGKCRSSIAVRTPLSELVDEKSLEKTRRNIDLIASSEVRDLVLAAFEGRLRAGDTLKQALSKPIRYSRYGTEIRRVRVIRDDVSLDKAVTVQFKSRGGSHAKLMVPDGNACVEIVEIDKTTKPRVVPQYEAARSLVPRKTDGVRRFFKCDTVIDRKDGERLVVKQIKSEGGGLLILVPVYESRPVRNLTKDDGLKKVSGSGLNRLVLADVIPPCAATGGSALPRG